MRRTPLTSMVTEFSVVRSAASLTFKVAASASVHSSGRESAASAVPLSRVRAASERPARGAGGRRARVLARAVGDRLLIVLDYVEFCRGARLAIGAAARALSPHEGNVTCVSILRVEFHDEVRLVACEPAGRGNLLGRRPRAGETDRHGVIA